MKVWFCRDKDGDCSTWDGVKLIHKPKLEDGIFKGRGPCLTSSSFGTFEMFGNGFHGVKKGRCTLLELEPLI